MSAQTPREIAFHEICEGDDIEGRWDHDGVSMTARGVVHALRDGVWHTEGGGVIACGYWPRWRYFLHDRTAPAEPKGLGAVVRARVPASGGRLWTFVKVHVEQGLPPWQGPGAWRWSDFDPDSIEVLSEGIEVES